MFRKVFPLGVALSKASSYAFYAAEGLRNSRVATLPCQKGRLAFWLPQDPSNDGPPERTEPRVYRSFEFGKGDSARSFYTVKL